MLKDYQRTQNFLLKHKVKLRRAVIPLQIFLHLLKQLNQTYENQTPNRTNLGIYNYSFKIRSNVPKICGGELRHPEQPETVCAGTHTYLMFPDTFVWENT